VVGCCPGIAARSAVHRYDHIDEDVGGGSGHADADDDQRYEDTGDKMIYVANADNLPSVSAILEDANGAINLTDSTVKFKTNWGLDATATIVNAATGSVRYDWVDGDIATAGTFSAWFVIEYDDGGVLTVPNDGFITINVRM
jgi:hypothetical protein